jgi:hypothetical protein
MLPWEMRAVRRLPPRPMEFRGAPAGRAALLGPSRTCTCAATSGDLPGVDLDRDQKGRAVDASRQTSHIARPHARAA